MMRGVIPAVLVLSGSVLAAVLPVSRAFPRAYGHPAVGQNGLGLHRPGRSPFPPGRAQTDETGAAAPATATREFQFHRLVFTVPVNWSVQRADQDQFRPRYVTVTGRPSGPRLTFSDTVQLVAAAGTPERTENGLSVQRYAMPNAATTGIVYIFPGAGVSVTAQVRTEAEARAADAVIQSARRALPRAVPTRS